MDAARRRAGLREFGDPPPLEPLRILTESIEREARLHPVGHFITRERLTSVLVSRLETHAAASPEVRALELEPPLVIAGLQRSGTTLLHRLLAADPRRRWLASWEALRPARPAGRTLGGGDPRVAAAVRAQRALRYLAPDFFAVHPVRARGPEEDVLLLDQALLSTVPEATLRVPTYARWLESADQRPAYEHLALLLRLLSWQRGRGKRWLLKTPHHLEWLDALFEVFDGARVIWTHRDPVVTVASLCSMIAHGRGVFSDAIDPREIGRDWSRKVARLVERAMATRDGGREARFIDVRYEDLVRDPIAVVRRIHHALGESFPPDVERHVRRALDAHPRHQHGRHVYALEDFGLSPGPLRERFAAYRERFVEPR